jgi:hypothetical protein
MKALALFIIAAVIVFLAATFLRDSVTDQLVEPEKALKHLYWNFPRGKGSAMKKGSSPGAPPTGEIYLYRPPLDLAMIFRWRNGHWQFVKLVTVENGRDVTYLPGGLEVMMDPPMRKFLAMVDWRPTSEDERVYLANQAGKARRSAAAEEGSPKAGSWMWNRKQRSNTLDRP